LNNLFSLLLKRIDHILVIITITTIGLLWLDIALNWNVHLKGAELLAPENNGSYNLIILYLSLILIVILIGIILKLFFKKRGKKTIQQKKKSSGIQNIKKDKELFRIMSTDRRIMPPNFASFYKLQDVSGYA